MRWLYLIFVLYPFQLSHGWNFAYISALMVPFHRLVDFQEIVWFISQQMHANHTEQVDQFIRIIDDAFGLTQTVVGNNSKLRMIQSNARRNHISFVFTTGARDPIMQVASKVLLGRHFYFILFMLMDKVDDMQRVYDICDFFYDNKFENTLVYFESTDGINQLYGITKYPVKLVENRTDLMGFMRKKYKDTLLAHMDTEGFEFLTPLRQDPPHLFQVRGKYDGSTYRIIKTFVQFLNGSLKELDLPPDALGGQVVNMNQTLQLVRERRIEFSAHAYALFMADDELEKSYPILVVPWCLMVPVYNSVSTFFYALQPFDWIVWFFTVGTFLALCLLEFFWLWLAPTAAAPSPTVVLFNSFCYVINIATGRQLLQPSNLRFLLLIAVFFHGFFLSANYTSILGSILTVNLFRVQLNTMEDLLRAQLPVMIIDYELEFLLRLNTDLPKPFRQLLRPVDCGVFAQHQTSFNSSFAYFVTEDNWQFLDEQQRHMKQRQFKFSEICFGSFHLAYPMQMDLPMWRDLEYYTFTIHSSGLHNYYAKSSFDSALQAGLVHRFSENKDFTSAGLQHLAIAFFLLLVMFGVALIIFGLEIFITQFWNKRVVNNPGILTKINFYRTNRI